jgi:hypothetical protein
VILESEESRFRRKSWSGGYYTFYSNFGRVKSVYAHLETDLTEGVSWPAKAIFIIDEPGLELPPAGDLKEFVRAGGTLVLMCREQNPSSTMRAVLGELGLTVFYPALPPSGDSERVTVLGDKELIEDVISLPRMPAVQISGAEPLVFGKREESRNIVYLAHTDLGAGQVYLLPFGEIFTTRFLGKCTKKPKKSHRRTRRMQENLIRRIVAPSD